jgi:hypothetical protein
VEDISAITDKIVTEAAATLKASFDAYWPTYGDTGAHERNLSLHIGSGLLRAGFAVSGEGHAEGDAGVRSDLVAYSQKLDLFVVGEFKQLSAASRAREMGNDITRIRDFRPVRRRAPDTNRTKALGIVAAFSEDDDRFLQLTSNRGLGPCKATQELANALPGGWKSLFLCSHGRHPGRQGKLFLVYSVVRIDFDL